MSLHRRAAKRDAAEPAIVSALEALGCVVWRVSGKGLPDLIVLRAGKKWLADVKAAKKGVTKPQADLWEEAATKAQCAVFILRTPEDAEKMLNNALEPWVPERFRLPTVIIPTVRVMNPPPPRKGDAAKALRKQPRDTTYPQRLARALDSLTERRGAGADYTPPRSTPVDAAKEAEETFAPGAPPAFMKCALGGCHGMRLYGPYCGEHRGMGDPD